jgi:hypothetical protein
MRSKLKNNTIETKSCLSEADRRSEFFLLSVFGLPFFAKKGDKRKEFLKIEVLSDNSDFIKRMSF